jgi:hypothetical protein
MERLAFNIGPDTINARCNLRKAKVSALINAFGLRYSGTFLSLNVNVLPRRKRLYVASQAKAPVAPGG